MMARLGQLDLEAAAWRLHGDFRAGRWPPSTDDLPAVGLLLARHDGCICDLAALDVTVSPPDGGDPRPRVRIDGHASTCPCHPGPDGPPGLRVAA